MDENLKLIFAENLKKQLSLHDKKQNDLAKYLGVSTATVSEWCSGKKMPRTDKIQSICNWLFIELDALLKESSEVSNQVESSNYKIINVLGRVAAGIPIDSISEIIDQEYITEEFAKTGEYFGLRIKGDSMSPVIMDGDTVIVRSQENAETDEIIIALINGHDGVCKKLKKIDNGLMLISINPQYAPLVFTSAEIDQTPVKIIGKVVEIRRKL